MRIAWTGPARDGGGVAGVGRLMLAELLRQGVEVDLYVVDVGGDPVPKALAGAAGLRVIELRSGWSWGRWYSRRKAAALFSGLIVRTVGGILLSIRLLIEHRRRRYDAVYQLSQTELFLLGRLRRCAPPIIVHPCTHAAGELRWHRAEQAYALASERRSYHLLMRAMLALRARVQPKELARADIVIGLSERFNEHVHEDYGVPLEKLRVLRTAVDLEQFSPDGPRIATGPRTLLYVSRISTRKGLGEIVELSHRLADLAGSVRLLVVGGVTQWSNYSAHLADLHPGVAEYVGPVEPEALSELLRSGAMLLVPSRYEPGSIVTAEALACGLPVVLSGEVGNAEVVAGPHARIHAAQDVDGLEAAVRSLLAALDGDEAALRAAARANAEVEFSADTITLGLIEIVATLAPGALLPRLSLDAPAPGRVPERNLPDEDALTRR